MPRTDFKKPGPELPLDKIKGGIELLSAEAPLIFGEKTVQGASVSTAMSDPAFQKPEFEVLPGVKGRVHALKLAQKPARRDSTRLDFALAKPVSKGDTLAASFYLRGTPQINPITGRPRVTLALENRAVLGATEVEGESFRATINQDRHAFLPVLADGWRRYVMPLRAPRDFAAGTAHLSFQLGTTLHTVEIAGVSLLGFGNRLAPGEIEALPRRPRKVQFNSPAYDESDRKADAPWRLAANARIEKLRKSNLQIRVTRGGRPLQGASVRVQMKRHAFRFGTAVGAEALLGEVKRKGISAEDSLKYGEFIKTYFNHAVLENDLKWPGWDANPALERLREMGVSTRGHTLFWPSFKHLPAKLQTPERGTDEALLRRTIIEHIREEAGALKGHITDWDAMNEPYTNYHTLAFSHPAVTDVLTWGFWESNHWKPDAALFRADWTLKPNGKAYEDWVLKEWWTNADAVMNSQGIAKSRGFAGDYEITVSRGEKTQKVKTKLSRDGQKVKVTL